eukprot:CAMPEP_0195514812 /NCGR_PEP_ID=MMETSP0794_2-20130614/6085_1 /TAXON_ID=515487 /ORGANISM="Stephanopyxis turris, Strain CCMP 815" /LENGTH=389 /DNA_ID=CAMNT_0040643137 /DNA_START=255 /DNA_END=1424 /DNA_ORIENTATION=+
MKEKERRLRHGPTTLPYDYNKHMMVLLLLLLVVASNHLDIASAHSSSSNQPSSPNTHSHPYTTTSKQPRSSPRYYERDDDEDDSSNDNRSFYPNKSSKLPKFSGLGREFERVIYPGRGGDDNTGPSSSSLPNATPSVPSASSGTYRRRSSTGSSNPNGSNRNRNRNASSKGYNYGYMGGRVPPSVTTEKKRRASSASKPGFITSAIEWIKDGNLPKIQVRVEPNTTLKLRKRFFPLKTTVTLGADFNSQLGVWQFKSSWEDRIIGGRLTLSGRELQLSKTWLLSVGAVEDLVTRLRFRAAVDMGTGKAYARFGFRTERLSPINVVEGFTLVKQLPLDGRGEQGNIKLEVKANFAFPEPEIEYSTEHQRSIVGIGDIEVNIDELNLLLDY